jgi:hypothetical protein
MFAWKSMDLNSNLLKLKLDMVYRDTPLEEAEARYKAILLPDLPDAAPVKEMETKVLSTRKRKVPKALAPKSA